eukprot:scaffold79113_cov33-Tisochrysis_lutea.AAC.5
MPEGIGESSMCAAEQSRKWGCTTVSKTEKACRQQRIQSPLLALAARIVALRPSRYRIANDISRRKENRLPPDPMGVAIISTRAPNTFRPAFVGGALPCGRCCFLCCCVVSLQLS